MTHEMIRIERDPTISKSLAPMSEATRLDCACLERFLTVFSLDNVCILY